MRKTIVPNTLLFLSALALVALANTPAGAQSTAFTYQGSLDDAGAPASGLHDFRFRLFAVASGGTPIGSTLCVDNVTVAEGVFTVQIDFGQQFATTAQRFLEIEVRRDTGLTCGNVAGFVLMTTRQQITATPTASHANSAFALDAADGSPASAVYVDDIGRVGIGTTAPGANLEIKGTDNSNVMFARRSTGTLTHNVWIDGLGNGSMQFLDGAGTPRISLGCCNTTYFDYGNVGIGTTAPSVPLHVRAAEPVLVLQDSDGNANQVGYLGFWNTSSSEMGWVGFGTPGSPHFTVRNARSGGNIALSPGAGGVVSVPVIEITGADLAERFPCSDEEVEPGTVMEIDPRDSGKLRIARGAYNRRVAGVVSGANDFAAGAVLGNLPGHENAPAIALSGRVYVLCDATNGSIEPGDLLTTSGTPGHAMKAADQRKAHGAILGKAMTGLESGRGTVLVLVSLQ